MIIEIKYSDILCFWSSYLWPGREDIKPMSSMLYLSGYDIDIYKKYKPVFLGYMIGELMVGVNSGHQTTNTHFRSRGLFVLPKYRGRGIGISLLKETITQAENNGCSFCWSLPRQTALHTYLGAGFQQTSEFIKTETSVQNCYVLKKTNV